MSWNLPQHSSTSEDYVAHPESARNPQKPRLPRLMSLRMGRFDETFVDCSDNPSHDCRFVSHRQHVPERRCGQ